MIDNDKWIRERLVPRLQDPGRALESCKKGVIYGYKRTESMSPIIIMNLRKVVDNGIDYDEFDDLVEFLYGYTIYAEMAPGKIEQTNTIVDFTDVHLFDIPLSSLAGCV